ncbi:MAG: PAS domain S-box protein, partial [Methanoregula sp.]|nr:PAS domain S-box protein [Methanoregula sp.]
SYLSWDARKQRGQYKDLFDHSEAGSLVLQTGKSGIIINEVNYRAAHILGTDAPDLSGRLFPGLFDNPKDYEKFSRTLEKDGVLYSFGSRLKKTEGEPVDVILSARKMPDARVIVSLVDVTEHKRAEDALHKANAELNFFSRILSDDLLTVTNSLSGIIRDGKKSAVTWESIDVFDRIDRMVYYVGRRLELTKSYQDLGSVPPVWIPVQAGVLEQAARVDLGTIALSVWVERLEIYADGLAKNIFYHLIDNAVWHGKSVTEIVVSSSNSDNGIDLIFEDNGVGIENEKKAALFSYGSDIHAGLGLSIDRKILGITGIAIEETGQPGKGARFEIHIPTGAYRDRAGGAAEKPGDAGENREVIRELLAAEFPLADTIWLDYHQTKGNPDVDRIFGVFTGDKLVSVARCTRHTDGYEVDGVFTPAVFRNHGYAKRAVAALVDACHNDTLYMYAVIGLTRFYQEFGFQSIGEPELPPTIRERYAFAKGEMKGSDVQPMMRLPGISWKAGDRERSGRTK